MVLRTPHPHPSNLAHSFLPPTRKGMWPTPHLLPFINLAYSFPPPTRKGTCSPLLTRPLWRQHVPPTNQQVYPKTPSFPNQLAAQQVCGKTPPHSPLFGLKKQTRPCAQSRLSLIIGKSAHYGNSVASVNLSFLHLGLNPENSFSTHVLFPQQSCLVIWWVVVKH